MNATLLFDASLTSIGISFPWDVCIAEAHIPKPSIALETSIWASFNGLPPSRAINLEKKSALAFISTDTFLNISILFSFEQSVEFRNALLAISITFSTSLSFIHSTSPISELS